MLKNLCLRSVDLVWKSASLTSVVRRLSASIFLLVMSLLVALHSPAVGYCAATESYFLGDHSEDHNCDHECADHREPLEHPHHMVLLDAGDFQWVPVTFCFPQFVEIDLLDWSVTWPLFVAGKSGVLILPANPPPPDVPIFRRDAALRV